MEGKSGDNDTNTGMKENQNSNIRRGEHYIRYESSMTVTLILLRSADQETAKETRV